MCASCISLLLILVSCSMRMVTEGLPLSRQERGVHQDIIAGADFLSVLMDSPALRQAYRELTTTGVPSTSMDSTLQIPMNSLNEYNEENTPVVRESRNPRSTTVVEPHSYTQTPIKFGAKIFQKGSDRTVSNKVDFVEQYSENDQNNSSLIISVQVSSSVGDSRINKIPNETRSSTVESNISLIQLVETTSEITTQAEQTAISFQDHPSLILESNNSELSVDEMEPITSNSSPSDTYTHEYPANVRPLLSFQNNHSTDKMEPYKHRSVVYHDNSKDAFLGRSVSYSTVIQTLPKQVDVKLWSGQNIRDRQERHYEIKEGAEENQFEKVDVKQTDENLEIALENPKTLPSSSVAENNDYFVTTKYVTSSTYQNEKPLEQKGNHWIKTEQTPKKVSEPPEKNWEAPEKQIIQREKHYSINHKTHNVPIVYGKPEQNYEVDESVSVMSNGRIHGIQSHNKSQLYSPIIQIKTDQSNDNQKVGYVVEGRNYRKYRVEERTSDGFIVGEYGVVSHDDGSLRGVRYTADGATNPRLIYDALMKFLSL